MNEREEGKFEGMVIEKLENIEDYLRTHDKRLKCVEKKQEKFSWYVGIAVGVGAFIMFAVDKAYDLIERIRG